MKNTKATSLEVTVVALRLGAAVLFLAAAQTARAAMPLATDDTGTLGAGRWQLEISSQYNRDASEGARSTEVTLPIPAIAYGVLENLDVVVSGAASWTETRAGSDRDSRTAMGDAGADLKWRFLDSTSIDLAAKVGAVFPTGVDSAGAGSYHALLILTAPEVAGGLHFNLGYAYNAEQDGVRESQWLASLALQVPVQDALSLVGEVGAEQSSEPGETEAPAFAQVGAILSLSETVDLDVGIRRGLTEAETDWSFTGGCTVRW